MRRTVIALAALAAASAALPAAAETWTPAGRGYAFDTDSVRYHAGADAIFIVRRWADGDAIVDSDLLILCQAQERWRLIDASTATWSGPFGLDPVDEAQRQRWCERGKAGSLRPYEGRLPAALGGPPPPPTTGASF